MTVDDSGFGGEETQDETDGFGGVVRTADEIEQDNQEQTEEEAEEALASGFGKVYKEPVTVDEDATPIGDETEQGQEVLGSTTGDQTQAEDTPEVSALKRRLRRLEGQMGTFLQDRNTNKAEVADTKEAIEAIKADLLKNQKEIDVSVGEFGELTPVVRELEHQAQRMAELESRSGGGSIDPMQIAELVDRGVMDAMRPGWDQKSATKEFRDFMLQGGGPTEAEYFEYARYNQLGTPESILEADKYLEDWEKDMPGWWEDKGEALFRGRAADSIKLLDRFEEGMRAIEGRRVQQESQTNRRANRLRSSSTPQGTSGDPVIGISDNEAFERGFKRQTGR